MCFLVLIMVLQQFNPLKSILKLLKYNFLQETNDRYFGSRVFLMLFFFKGIKENFHGISIEVLFGVGRFFLRRWMVLGATLGE